MKPQPKDSHPERKLETDASELSGSDTHNKIPQEIEEKIFADIVNRFLYGGVYKDYLSRDVNEALREAIYLSFKAGQTQERENVLKLINDWAKIKCIDGKEKCHECVNELKSGVKNAKED